jgi:hypothetical protein
MCVPLNSLVGIIRDITNGVSRVILPLILLIGTNVALILKLKRVGLIITNRSVYLKRERRFAVTITIMNIIYVIANFLTLITTLFINLYGYDQTYVSTSSYESSLASFVNIFVQLAVLFINCDLAFIVNLLSNKTFRKEARKLVFFR